ncbi:DUF2268 domain-containing protein [Virgibacillus sp. NKC19-3]|uniref:DUF2268 domain-containing protein n=1 Tax=Virgibacillus saliphilus TaxID=2831674 RepID=UPI001C9B3F7C|nr:DUF2268 domain-containing protein [Virgibacillus sp. NKC19-3]MBY7142025.1 DUF2268 domain-containing protein [Virgibacillus sp. NKC19-3]
MGVIRTDKWLLDLYDEPSELCEKLVAYFERVLASEIHEYLTMHGMYRTPSKNIEDLLKKLKNNNVWKTVHKEKQYLQEEWDGPDVPIFIFPSDTNNQRLIQDSNGKSGLAFSDKLFLFISEENDEEEIRALFTHEYHHVCRLSKYPVNIKDFVLLDTIILEGLAENAVREGFGEKLTASWTSYYSNQQLEKMQNKLVIPNKSIQQTNPRHQRILYGLGLYPKMAGYCVGYHIVKAYMEANKKTTKDVLHMPTDTFMKS